VVCEANVLSRSLFCELFVGSFLSSSSSSRELEKKKKNLGKFQRQSQKRKKPTLFALLVVFSQSLVYLYAIVRVLRAKYHQVKSSQIFRDSPSRETTI
jgi:hypothetical protein